MMKKKVVKPKVKQKNNQKVNIHGKPILDDEVVLSYLQDNPNFFMRNANQVDRIQVPHGIHGTVSLVEWQLKRQRERIMQLEEEITALFETAYQNEHLFNQLLNLILSLSIANSLDDFAKRLNSWSRKLGLSYVEIRLFSELWNVLPPFEKTEWGIDRERFESLRINRLSQSRHFLGQLNSTELNLVLTQRVLVGSVALSMLALPNEFESKKETQPIQKSFSTIAPNPDKGKSPHIMVNEKNAYSGFILFVSPNENHFQKGLDTALLDKLSELLPNLLSKWITLK
ncbi:DUF484 family protein [Thorsellia kenyensis]|uniref:DUF484 family protein n=1 Tax=Thorsellia kenyensis TaxID=1549888 RepID=A0ABV6C8A7_9GAMM